ncbi:High mobility group box domain containing protein [Trema orientale]|uniref:High mobility group box domain containing protein n=1 Tax=Trema orientale TaxID=63057 RepID=A0A2P5DJ49_TREOI|nr:High mobility group box domain containing protein [Trema orientale]
MDGSKSKSKSARRSTSIELKRKRAGGGRKAGEMAVKDPNKPKKPAKSLLLFVNEFKEQYKKEHPNEPFALFRRAHDKWKSMSHAERAPFVGKARKMAFEYDKNMHAYLLAEGADGSGTEESDRSESNSEVDDKNDERGGYDDMMS